MIRSSQDGWATVPHELAGRWIAWNCDVTAIVASGETAADALREAIARGEASPVIGKSPTEGLLLTETPIVPGGGVQILRRTSE